MHSGSVVQWLEEGIWGGDIWGGLSPWCSCHWSTAGWHPQGRSCSWTCWSGLYCPAGVDLEAAKRLEEEQIMLDARAWLTEGLPRDIRHPRTGATPLHVAAAKGYLEAIKYVVVIVLINHFPKWMLMERKKQNNNLACTINRILIVIAMWTFAINTSQKLVCNAISSPCTLGVAFWLGISSIVPPTAPSDWLRALVTRRATTGNSQSAVKAVNAQRSHTRRRKSFVWFGFEVS